jgi:PPK2 family polyphosphate:nucleotide phosphotransferase
MKIRSDAFRVHEGKSVHLKQWPTLIEPTFDSKDKYRAMLSEHVRCLSDFQQLHYASNKNALLLIFQGMDAAGKDGTIRHVMSGVNPQGVHVFSFKAPTNAELEHDFLWRTTRDLPERGKIGIFNRSYYEDVLIARVHPEILISEGVDTNLHEKRSKSEIWGKRYRSINDLEKHLHENGTQVLKFFLHLSFDEQARRFLERIDDKGKNWKLSHADMKERSNWPHYMRAYEECLEATSTERAPWFVIPADEKLNARLIVSQIILDTFRSFKMKIPKADNRRVTELVEIRKELKASLEVNS